VTKPEITTHKKVIITTHQVITTGASQRTSGIESYSRQVDKTTAETTIAPDTTSQQSTEVAITKPEKTTNENGHITTRPTVTTDGSTTTFRSKVPVPSQKQITVETTVSHDFTSEQSTRVSTTKAAGTTIKPTVMDTTTVEATVAPDATTRETTQAPVTQAEQTTRGSVVVTTNDIRTHADIKTAMVVTSRPYPIRSTVRLPNNDIRATTVGT